MRPSTTQGRSRALVAALVLGIVASAASLARGADYGRLSGTVLDTDGDPLMGATIMVVGPLLDPSRSTSPDVERIVTDARGRFTLARLAPGWYSLRVFSPTRLPAVRNRIQVKAGETARQDFVLGDILAPLRIEPSHIKVTTQGEDWKWILRTSASTRPVLRFRGNKKRATQDAAVNLPGGQRMFGVLPGSSRRGALSNDAGPGSVLAYFRPLSEDSDMLLAGSMTADGMMGSSLVTAFRRNLQKGDPQELTLTVHQLGLAEGVPLPAGSTADSLSRAQAVVVSYTRTKRISEAISVTTGMEIDYLTALTDAQTTLPFAQVEYRLGPSSELTFSYGAARTPGSDSLLDRVGELNSFPRVTLRANQLQLERLNHSEARYSRQLGHVARFEVAAYRDAISNAALWGFGGADSFTGLTGNYLPNPISSGVTLNGGNYASSGMRVTLAGRWGQNLEGAFLYSTGQTLAVAASAKPPEGISQANFRDLIRPEQAQAVGGRLSCRVPASHTKIVTSYEWLPRGLVSALDPYGSASLEIAPYLGLQIRQPLPQFGFFPAHIEALADFSNLLAEGYVPVSRTGEDRLLLTPAYRSFRGGFSVQF